MLEQIQTGGSTVAVDETNAIATYLTSHDIVDELAKQDGLHQILSRPEADFLFRYPTFWLPNNNEVLYQRFQWMTSVDVDEYTDIITIEVNAFRPEDARALLAAMLGHAEALVNELNERMYKDSFVMTNHFVAEAQKNVDAAVGELEAYRKASGSIDPGTVAQSKLTVIQLLSTQLAELRATIAQQAAISPTSPSLNGLRAQSRALSAEIEKRKLEAAGSVGSEAEKLETYDNLQTTGQIAAQSLSAVTVERDQAQQNAERQHIFIQMIAKPNLALDYARYPRVGLDLLILLGMCLAVFQASRKIRDVISGAGPEG